MSLFDFDIEAAMKHCSARIWAMDHPEEFKANKKRSRCKATDEEIAEYRGKMDKEASAGEALENINEMVSDRNAVKYRNMLNAEGHTKNTKRWGHE